MSSTIWTNRNVLKLIDEYKSYPVLWDMNLKDYKNRNQKTKAWQEIANTFNVDKSEVIRKMNIILTQFRRERNKLLNRSNIANNNQMTDILSVDKTNNSNSNNDQQKDLEMSKWFAFKSLMFLMEDSNSKFFQKIPFKMCQTDYDDSINLCEAESPTPPPQPIKICEKEELMPKKLTKIVERQSTFSNPESTTTIIRPNKRKLPFKSKDDLITDHQQQQQLNPAEFSTFLTKDNNTADRANKYNNQGNERDEYTIFGENVACKLRKLKSDRIRCLAQYKINTILFQAEMDSFGSGSQTTNNSGNDLLMTENRSEQQRTNTYNKTDMSNSFYERRNNLSTGTDMDHDTSTEFQDEEEETWVIKSEIVSYDENE